MRRGQAIANQPVLERVLADDPRSPVLYLRAFNRESQGFAVGDASKYGAYVEGCSRYNGFLRQEASCLWPIRAMEPTNQFFDNSQNGTQATTNQLNVIN